MLRLAMNWVMTLLPVMLSIRCADVPSWMTLRQVERHCKVPFAWSAVLELAFEQNRLYDIRRWTDTNGKKVISNILGPNGSFVKWNTEEATRDALEWENQGEASDKGITFNENRDMVFPIPLYEITMSNGSITQNPGWN